MVTKSTIHSHNMKFRITEKVCGKLKQQENSSLIKASSKLCLEASTKTILQNHEVSSVIAPKILWFHSFFSIMHSLISINKKASHRTNSFFFLHCQNIFFCTVLKLPLTGTFLKLSIVTAKSLCSLCLHSLS